MNSVKFQIVTVVALMAVLLLPHCSATNYTVGDSSQWNTGVNYNAWVSGKTFAVGDRLIFLYTTNHDVLELSNSAYDACNTGSPIRTQSGGSTTVTLDATGGKWFACGTAGHCAGGMKLAVNVTAAAVTPAAPASPPPPGATTSSPPPPGSTTTPPPPPGSTNTTAPPPSAASVAGALHVRMMVAFTLCVALVLLL